MVSVLHTCKVSRAVKCQVRRVLRRAKFLCSLPKVLGQHPDSGKDITLNSGRYGPYLKCENKSARLETSEDIFTIGLNRAVTLLAEAKPGRISSSEIKHLGEHPKDKKPVRVMKGKFGPYIKYKSLNATIPEEKDHIEITMDDALVLIEKRKEYDRNKKGNKRKEKKMSKFMNVVRSKVKEDKKDEYMKKLKEFFDNMKGTEGLISMKQIQTSHNNMCIIGEWKDEQSIAKARDKMIAGLDTVRLMLEEISPELGVTDPVAGPVILESK